MTAEAIVGRCLDALELLSLEPRGLPLTTIAQKLGLLKGGAHRLLAELQAEGFLTQDAGTQHYRLTMRFPTLGFRHLTGTGIVDAAMPSLRTLAEATGELVRMTVADADALSWVAKAQGARMRLRFEPDMGGDVRLHTTASGKVWLSSMSDEAAVALVRAKGFGVAENRGRNSIRSLKQFLRELQATRERGYGVAIDEDEPGMSAAAVNIPHPRARIASSARSASPVPRCGSIRPAWPRSPRRCAKPRRR
jgi:DNA-binding IclR family transcriptional regulator